LHDVCWQCWFANNTDIYAHLVLGAGIQETAVTSTFTWTNIAVNFTQRLFYSLIDRYRYTQDARDVTLFLKIRTDKDAVL